jgi:hypothetical protein
VTNKPDKVEGIPVGHKVARLHILHATGHQEKDGTVIGSYTIHYEDKSKATIAIVYGEDVRDWWFSVDTDGVKRSKVAWEGTNAAVKSRNAKIRLFLTTWKNPQPRKKIVSIDFASKKTRCSPFCVAMTVETK